ncbi:MAG: STAS domain-containing protein [Betaproteobacteria bacterium]|nr:STAS domain-containing protein [Betaproteobacteria bacterium]
MPDPLRVEVERRSGLAVVRLAGHLGIDGHRALQSACDDCLADPRVTGLRLDLCPIESTDATALGLLLVLRERCRRMNKAVTLTGCASLTRRGLGAIDLQRHFTVL